MSADRPARGSERHDGDAASDGAAIEPEVVDFDALHAALGELTPAPASAAPVSESSGRLNASYSSTRPHAPPSTRPPRVDLQAPAVIVAQEDTVPSGPPKMTVPLGLPKPRGATAPVPPPAVLAPPPSRPRMPTVILRTRGPTTQQKLLVFMAMLLVFVSGGVAFLIYGRNLGFDLR